MFHILYINRPLGYAHKKSVTFSVFIGAFEVFDYLILPITTYKFTLNAERRRLVWKDF